MKRLSSDQAMAIIAKNAELLDPTTDAGCIKCHSTAGGY